MTYIRNRAVSYVVACSLTLVFTFPAPANGDEALFPQAYGKMPSSDDLSGGEREAQREDPFWKQLEDPVLEELISRGLAGNLDVEVARQRVRGAEAVAGQMMAPLLPAVRAEASYNMSPFNNVGQGLDLGLSSAEMASNPMISAMATGVGETKIRHSTSALLKVSYAVDLAGRNLAAFRAAKGEIAAASADGETLALNLTFLITQAYLAVTAAQKRQSLLEEQIKTNEALLELVEARLDQGSANALDVLQQKQQLIATRAQLPLLQSIVITGRNQLAILTGMESVSELPPIGAEIPKFKGEPTLGDPERLLSARPEMRALSERLRVAEQREKSAFRALLPSLMLSGQVGYTGNYIDKYDDGETWGVAALLSVPLYEGGRNLASLDQARAGVASAVSARRQGAKNAVEQVESSLARYQASKAYYEALIEQLKASRLAFEEARRRYAAGLIDYLNVLISLASYQQLELAQVQAEHDVIMSRVGLHTSLGGKWTNELMRNRAE